MTEDQFLTAQERIQAAIARAKLVLGYFSGEEETAQIHILEDGRARLTTWNNGYDGGSIEIEQQHFPAQLLFCTEQDVADWAAERRRQQEAELAVQNAT